MKYKVKITNLSFDLEFQPIWEMEPPKPEPKPEKPPIVAPMPPIDVTEVFDLDEYLKGKQGVVYLPNEVKVIRSKGMIKPEKVTALIGKNIVVTFENWEVTPNQLFDLSGCKEFGISGITFVCPPNRPIKTAFPDKEVFGWNRDTVESGKFAYINGQEIKDKDRVTFGLCRFGYSSKSDKPIHLIGKNISHNGFNFTQIKNPYKGNLWLTLQNVNIHNPIIEAPQSHFCTPTRIKCRIKVKDGIAKIISDNTFDQILTWVGFNNGNQRSILHFDRFVYDISESKLLDMKTLNLDYPDELQAGDNIEGMGEVIQKQIDFSRKTNWTYTYQMNDKPTSKNIPEGEFDAFIVYKGNAGFSSPFLTKDSKFGDWYITISQGYGWTVYNEEHSGYYENCHFTGFNRLSGGSGITNGLTIRNCTFGPNAPIATANNDMPKEAKQYITYLESL